MHNDGVHSTQEISTPRTTQEEELEQVDEFVVQVDVKARPGQKCFQG